MAEFILKDEVTAELREVSVQLFDATTCVPKGGETIAGGVVIKIAKVGLIRFSGRVRYVDRSSWFCLLSMKETMGVEPVGNRVLCGFP